MAKPVPVANSDTDPLLAFASEPIGEPTAAILPSRQGVTGVSTASQTSRPRAVVTKQTSSEKQRRVNSTLLLVAVVSLSLFSLTGVILLTGRASVQGR